MTDIIARLRHECELLRPESNWRQLTEEAAVTIENLTSALNEVMQWIHEWEPAFLQDDEWKATDMLVHQALYPLTPETAQLNAKEIRYD
jgi:hypothetical protein